MYREHSKYPHLFSPLKINNLILKNRIFYAPVEYYHDRALSGSAVMMRGTSGTLNDPKCRITPGKWLFSDSEMPRVKQELSMIKRAGSFASLEVMHAGFEAHLAKGEFVIGPSDGVNKYGNIIKQMDRQMMDQMIHDFVETCLIAKQIGYDMVMIHFAHGWIASQFFSPKYNRRTDEYGGSYENRVRFPKEILKAIRTALGKNYPIDMRISAYEDFEGCMSKEEVIQFIKDVSDEGYIDCVNVSYGGELTGNGNTFQVPSAFDKDMCYAEYAAEIKKVVKVPVIVVGKIMMPEEAEMIIEKQMADAVVIGRASIADPYWAKKAFECRSEDIVPCISCGKCFSKRCSVNIRGYMENLVPLKLEKDIETKKVMIVGGGPAGMKAALTASEKGYDVVLYEASDALGGLLKTADYDENKRELKRYKDYLINQVKKTPIEIKWNTPVTRHMIVEENPDQLILAMGSLPITPKIEGVENAIQSVIAHEQIDNIGKNVVLIGGGLVGCEFALTLALRGHSVSIIERTSIYGGMNDDTTFRPYDMIKNMSSIKVYLNSNCNKITKDSVIFINEQGEEISIPSDTTILSVGFRSNNDKLDEYYGIVPNTIVIGDLRRPSCVRDCEEEGYFSVANI